MPTQPVLYLSIYIETRPRRKKKSRKKTNLKKIIKHIYINIIICPFL
jgi:hypothetical protein